MASSHLEKPTYKVEDSDEHAALPSFGSKERERVLRTIGERIFRPKTFEIGDVRMTVLGGAQEVGRSAFLVKTRESSVLLDCGINPGSQRPFETFPRFDSPEFQIDSLDAVIISHAHLDHCGLVPSFTSTAMMDQSIVLLRPQI